MRYQRAILSSASVALCVWPLQVLAQSEGGFALEEAPEKEPVVINTSSAELGVGWISEDSFKLGEYTGMTDEGPYPIANIDFLWRAPYDGTSTEYWKFYGTNLGLDSRSVEIEAGQQGKFSVFLNYSEIPHFQQDDAATPYIGSGSGNLTLPNNWDSADNTPTQDPTKMTELDNSLNPIRLKTERTRYGGGFTFDLGKEWTMGASYKRENKDGLESLAGIFGSSGGNPRAAILPKPIDYTTQDANVFLAYNSDKLQAQLSYHLSQFDDNTSTLTFQNAYEGVGGWDADQGYTQGGFGRIALEPDNTAHSVALSMGYTPDPTTRIAGNFTYTRMLQDADFLPYSTTGFGVDGISFGPLPRDSLDGDITKIHGALSAAKRFTPDLSVSGQYTYDDRDNNTPTDIFCYVHSDTADQDEACEGTPDENTVSESARINRPYSRTEHDVKLDATYRVMPSTKVSLGYHFEAIKRDFTEVENTYEHTGSIKLMSSPTSFATGWLKYSFSDRSGSDYIGNEPVLASHTLATIEEEGGEEEFWEANYLLRKYYIGDRRRHHVQGSLNLMATDSLTVGLMGSFNLNDYHNTRVGLTDRNFASGTIDVTYTPNEDVALYGFFTYDRMKNKQTGYERRGGEAPTSPNDPRPLDPDKFWNVNTLDQGYTVGVGADWTVIKDKLKLGVDYTYSHTDTEYDFAGDAALGAEPVPNVTSTLHSAGIRAEYSLGNGATASLFYRYEMFDNDDFANDVGSSLPYVITLGSTDLDYSAHLVGVTLRYRF